MEQPLAQRILTAIRAQPGTTPAELRVLARAGLASILAELDRLELEGRAFRAWTGRRSFAFAGTPPPEAERAQLAALAAPGTRAVGAALARIGRADIEALAEAAGLRPRTVYTHVEVLVAARLADIARGPGTSRVLVATQALKRGLERFSPTVAGTTPGPTPGGSQPSYPP